MVPSLELIAEKSGSTKAAVLAQGLEDAIGRYLEDRRSPSRKVNEIDNRGSSFYLTLAWAQALAAQQDDAEMRARFGPLAQALEENEATIVAALLAAQGEPMDIGGYYHPDDSKCEAAMRPSDVFNTILGA